jgi:hypothetical protein
VNYEIYLILAGIGVFAGVMAGLLGVGGGVIIVPALVTIYSHYFTDNPYIVQTSIATSLFTIIFTAISSAYRQSKHGNVLWIHALLIGLSSSLAVFLFSKIALSLPGDTLKKVFAIVVILISAKMLTERKKNNQAEGEEPAKINKALSPVTGVLGGAVAAFTGLGGGLFLVPMMHYFQKIPIKKSIGTSSAAIIITSISGVLSYLINMPANAQKMNYSIGMVDTVSAIPIIVASIPSAQLGVYLNKRLHQNYLTKIFGAFLLIMAVKMFFF